MSSDREAPDLKSPPKRTHVESEKGLGASKIQDGEEWLSALKGPYRGDLVSQNVLVVSDDPGQRRASPLAASIHNAMAWEAFLRAGDPFKERAQYGQIILDLHSPLPPFWDLLRALESRLSMGGALVLVGMSLGALSRADTREGFSEPQTHLIALLRLVGFTVEAPIGEESQDVTAFLLSRRGYPRWRLQEVRPEDVNEALELFQRVFKSEISRAFWAWKYGEGRGHSIVARASSGALVAHYGASRRRLLWRGQAVLGLQIGDVMVDSKERGVLSHQGAFFKVAAAFQESYYGYTRRFEIAYGFPNHRAMRVAERLSLYKKVDRILEVRWPNRTSRRFTLTKSQSITAACYSSGIPDQLWGSMRENLKDQLLVIRDGAYLRFRYRDHPEGGYEGYLITHRITRRPIGWVVLKEEEDHVRLMDIVARPQEISWAIESVRQRFSQTHQKELRAWITPAQMPYYQSPQAHISETDIEIPTHALTRGIPPEELEGRWWVSMGDTDFL